MNAARKIDLAITAITATAVTLLAANAANALVSKQLHSEMSMSDSSQVLKSLNLMYR